jgi:hypothetical protein
MRTPHFLRPLPGHECLAVREFDCARPILRHVRPQGVAGLARISLGRLSNRHLAVVIAGARVCPLGRPSALLISGTERLLVSDPKDFRVFRQPLKAMSTKAFKAQT